MSDTQSRPSDPLPGIIDTRKPEPDGEGALSISAVLGEAWRRTDGAKLTINLALAIYMLVITIALPVLVLMLLGKDVETLAAGGGSALSRLALQVAMLCINAPLMAGLFMIGLKRAVDAPITPGMIMHHYGKLVPLVVATLIMYVMLFLGFLLLILPGIYLSVAYCMALPLVVEKDLGPWQALETSRKAVGRCWFRTFGLMLVLSIANTLTVFTLFIATIWTVPWSVIAWGVLYRELFGAEPATAMR